MLSLDNGNVCPWIDLAAKPACLFAKSIKLMLLSVNDKLTHRHTHGVLYICTDYKLIRLWLLPEDSAFWTPKGQTHHRTNIQIEHNVVFNYVTFAFFFLNKLILTVQ